MFKIDIQSLVREVNKNIDFSDFCSERRKFKTDWKKGQSEVDFRGICLQKKASGAAACNIEVINQPEQALSHVVWMKNISFAYRPEPSQFISEDEEEEKASS